MECESRIYRQNCNCVLYYLPKESDDITICGRSDDGCVDEVTKQLQLKQNNSFVCECPPACFAVKYETEISLTSLMRESNSLYKMKLDARNVAKVHIFFRESYARSQIKNEFVDFTGFLCKLFSFVFIVCFGG